MRIGFDVDGVIYRFTKAYHLWMNQTYGMSLDPEVEAHSWDWYEDWETLDQFRLNLHDGVDAGLLYWQGELYEPSISQNLADLRAAGHTIHVVTARFYGVLKSSEDATKHFFEQNRLVYDSIDFSKVKESVKTDLFLEDNLRNYDALEAAGVTSYLVNRPYNLEKDDSRRRVNSVNEFTQLILEEKWQQLECISAS
jgi:FMN phosphatase YigB (HAD superfamily)